MTIAMLKTWFAVATLSALASFPAHAGPKKLEFKGLVIGAKTTSAQVLKATGVKCGNGANSMQVCNGPVRIGETSLTANIMIDGKGFLQRIYMTMDSSAFDKIAPALIEKYGAPDSEANPMLQNSFGAQYQQTRYIWMTPDESTLYALRYNGEITQSVIAFTTKADRDMISESGQARASDL
ncbi:hypothetical protein [Rhizobium leguminosarum]|uniref:hypothetical protein n=1 Tax=Rhizobium leguminosarum TaxID=384 RepID=UPI001C98AA52|nr:hypothetical protein [Rhizobium leguminosarum]MBY5698426.1 hypothetical protein [Rhizobium leguminosarum]